MSCVRQPFAGSCAPGRFSTIRCADLLARWNVLVPGPGNPKMSAMPLMREPGLHVGRFARRMGFIWRGCATMWIRLAKASANRANVSIVIDQTGSGTGQTRCF